MGGGGVFLRLPYAPQWCPYVDAPSRMHVCHQAALRLQPLQAFARTLRYRYAPVDELEQSPDAQFFPGLAPSGTLPTVGSVTYTVRTCYRQPDSAKA